MSKTTTKKSTFKVLLNRDCGCSGKNKAKVALTFPNKEAFHQAIQTSHYREYVLSES